MKSYKQFCEDANIQEFWNPIAPKVSPSKPKPVLAYKDYKQGFGKGKDWKPGKWNPEQEKRYGWKPIKASSYSKADTPGSLTASGHKFDDSQRLVAVPYKSKTSNKPSIPFKTKLDLTTKPVGKETKIAKTSVQDTGNFGPAGDYNKSTSMDLSLRTAKDLAPVSKSTEWGKRKIYVRNTPEPISAKVAPKRK
jgi:hypothetical protein